MTKTALYRHYDAEGQLLYVGISTNPIQRMKAHSWGSFWAQDIATIRLEWFEAFHDAARAELIAIKSEGPQHNSTRVRRLNEIQAVVDAWPTRAEFASQVGCNPQAAQKWAQSGRVPAKYSRRFVDAAQSQGLKHVTADWLLSIQERSAS